MDNKIKNALARANEVTDLKYIQDIRDNVRSEYDSSADEIAILRKEIALLREIIVKKLNVDLNDEEFQEYNKKIENLKASIRKDIGI